MEDQIRHYQNKLAYEIDSWDVYEAQKSGANIIVLDVRPLTSYQKEHIAGAVSFPHRTMVPENVAHLDRNAEYVTYCDGIGCNASTGGALKMARLGFKVKELIGGLAWWSEHGYPTVKNDQSPVTAEMLGTPEISCACE